MRNRRIVDFLWIMFSFFILFLTIVLVLVWGALFLDPLMYFPQFGVIFLLVSILIITSGVYGIRRYIQLYDAGLPVKPSLLKRLSVGVIIVSISMSYPMAMEYVPIFQEYDNPSDYNNNPGEQLILNYNDDIYDEIPGAPSAHASSVILLPNGELFAVWFAGTGEKHPDVAIYGSHCTPERTDLGGDYNLTWDDPVVVADTIDKSEGNPVLYMCPNGTLVLFYLTLRPTGPLFPDGSGPILEAGWSLAKIKMKSSNDYGYTWSEPKFLRDDYFWVLRDHPLLTTDDHVLLPFYREAMQYQSFFYRNPDPNLGGEWRVTGRLRTPHGCLQPSIVQLDNGRILCLMRTSDDRIYRSHSDDGGYTWTRAVAMRFPNPNSHLTMQKLNDGRILILCNPHTYSRGTLSLIVGDPTGEHWSEPMWLFNNQGMSFSYPSMALLPDNTIVCTFSQNKGLIGYARFNLTQVNEIDLI